jgi:hypothetical protein
MMYCRSQGGKELKTMIVNTLGWWHSYKTACYLLYNKLSRSLFAGCFHALYPANIFYAHPSNLTTILTIFQYIRIGYPEFKQELARVIIQAKVNKKCMAHLQNIQSLCEFFIPTVLYIYFLSSNSKIIL